MYKREAEFVNEQTLADPLNMNLKLGGEGGWSYINSIKSTEQIEEKRHFMSCIMPRDKKVLGGLNSGSSERMKKFHKDGVFRYDTFTGKHHSEESKKKIGAANSIHQSGSGNSQFGTCWVHSVELQECKKIKKDDLELFIEQGWIKGRKMKFSNTPVV